MLARFTTLTVVSTLMFLLSCGAEPQQASPEEASSEAEASITRAVIAEHIKTLSSDAYEGRGPGKKGAELARNYIIQELKKAGATAGNHGEWTQQVPLRSVLNSQPSVTLTGRDNKQQSFKYGVEFVAENRRGPGLHSADGELVFVGHGVQAPEYDWDDYEGLDCKGKILVMLVGDPPADDESLFGGKEAMTYYGRWTYKFEKAREMGAAGCIVVHRSKWAGYGWSVIQNSNAGRHMNVLEDDYSNQMAMEAWISWPCAQKLMRDSGQDLDKLCDLAKTRAFKPVTLPFTLNCVMKTSQEEIADHNVVGLMTGSDPYLKNEYLIYTAHYDHLGMMDASQVKAGEDRIYNGAVDNASGCAAVLAMAQAFGKLKGDHRRSVVFLFVGSEEQGLLGSKYYAQNPIFPVNKTIANINIDSMNVFEATRDLEVVGTGQSDLEDLLAVELKKDGRVVLPDSATSAGLYYRSDHFNFAKVGIPALYTKGGSETLDGKSIKEKQVQWKKNDYHRVSDEFSEEWSLGGAVGDARVLFRLGRVLLERDAWPKWSDNSEFKAIRDKSLGR